MTKELHLYLFIDVIVRVVIVVIACCNYFSCSLDPSTPPTMDVMTELQLLLWEKGEKGVKWKMLVMGKMGKGGKGDIVGKGGKGKNGKVGKRGKAEIVVNG